MSIEILFIVLLLGLAFLLNPYSKKKSSDVDIVSTMNLGFIIGYREGFRDSKDSKINKFAFIDGSEWYLNHIESLRSRDTTALTIKSLENLTLEKRKEIILSFIKANNLEDINNLDVDVLNKMKNLLNSSVSKEDTEMNLRLAVSSGILYLVEIVKNLEINDTESVQKTIDHIVKYYSFIIDKTYNTFKLDFDN